MSKILKNSSGSDISISDTGVTVEDNEQYTIPPVDYLLWAESADVIVEITSGDLVLNTGDVDLSVADALNYILYSDQALSVHFKNNGEVSNGFASSNAQDAIEEAKDLAQAAIFPISIVWNGTASGTFFFSYSNLTPNSPMIVPVESNFVGFTFSNSKSTADYILNFRNDTNIGTPFYTITKNNTQSFAQILPSPELFAGGDFISVQYEDDGTNSNDVVIQLFFSVVG